MPPIAYIRELTLFSKRSKVNYICKKISMVADKDYIVNTIKGKKSEIFRFGIKSIGLFGSYARNEQSENSDIDLLIEFEPGKENFDNFMAVYDIIEGLFESNEIEIVTKNGLSPYFESNILNEVQYV